MDPSNSQGPHPNTIKADSLTVAHCVTRLGLKSSSEGWKPTFEQRTVKAFRDGIRTVVNEIFRQKGVSEIQKERGNPNFLDTEAESLLLEHGPKIWGREDREHLLQAGRSELYAMDLYFDVDRNKIKDYTRAWLQKSIMDKAKHAKSNRRSAPGVEHSMTDTNESHTEGTPDTDRGEELPLLNSNANPFIAPVAPMHTMAQDRSDTNQISRDEAYMYESVENVTAHLVPDDENDPSYKPGRAMSIVPRQGRKYTGTTPKRKRATDKNAPVGRTKRTAKANRTTHHGKLGQSVPRVPPFPSASEDAQATVLATASESSSASSIEPTNHVEDFLRGQNQFASSYDGSQGLPLLFQRATDNDDLDSVIPQENEFSQEQQLDRPTPEPVSHTPKSDGANPVTLLQPASQSSANAVENEPWQARQPDQSTEAQEANPDDGDEAGLATPVIPQQQIPTSNASLRVHSLETLQTLVEIIQQGTPSSDVITKLDQLMNGGEFKEHRMEELNALKPVYTHWVNMHRELASFRDATGYKGRVGDFWSQHAETSDKTCSDEWESVLRGLTVMFRWARQVKADGRWIDKGALDVDLATDFSVLLQDAPTCNPQALLRRFERYNMELLEFFGN